MAGTDFHILCGFLGSGKTTLLLDFLAGQDAADTAVLVNDVGRIDVDGAVVGRSSTGLPVAMLPNGCVCCSIGNELVASVETLVADRDDAGLPPFRRMILECSGLSRPGPIVRSLGDLGRHDFRVRVLATFDAGQGAAHAVHFEEAAAQLAAAQTIVLSKLDLDGAGPVEAAAAAARAINPSPVWSPSPIAPHGRQPPSPATDQVRQSRRRRPSSGCAACCTRGSPSSSPPSRPAARGRRSPTGSRTWPPAAATGCCG